MEILIPFIILALMICFLNFYFKRKVNRTRLVLLTIVFSLLFIAGIIIGLFIGMNLGGNYYGDFVFNGLRGYEAVGQIGAIIGGLLGALLGFVVVLLIVRVKGSEIPK
jgi:hypothetical protein